MNNVVLTGRLTHEPQKIENDKVIITLAVNRIYKNEEGCYETDFIQCVLSGTVATSTFEYCRKGDLVGVKGRLENLNDTSQIAVVADKVTFLTAAHS